MSRCCAILVALSLMSGLATLVFSSQAEAQANPDGTCEPTYNGAIVDECEVAIPVEAPCDTTYNEAIVDGCVPVFAPGGEEDGPDDEEDGTGGGFTPALVLGPLPGGSAISTSIDGDIVTVVFPADLIDALDPNRRVLVEYNPVVFDAILPANGTVAFTIPRNQDSVIITITATLRSGATYIESIPFTRPAIAAAAAAAATPAVSTQAAAIAVPVSELAVTGAEAAEGAKLVSLFGGLGFAALGIDRVVRRRNTDR